MKKTGILAISICILMLLIGCGKKNEITPTELSDSFVLSEVFSERLEGIDSSVAEKRYGLNKKDYTELVSCVGTQGTVDEVCIVKTNNVENVKSVLNMYLKNKIKEYKDYRPAEVHKLQNPYMTDYNGTVVMVISYDNKLADTVFNKYLKD